MENLISDFVQFSSGIAKCLPLLFILQWKGDWVLGYTCTRFCDFPKISPFFTILSLNVGFLRLRKFLPN